MKIPVDQALETTQMIVPEVDLGITRKAGRVHINPIPLDLWGLYLNSLENACETLLDELGRLPDVDPVTEIEAIALDMSCLATSVNMFYMCMMEEIKIAYKAAQSVSKPNFKRYSRYRKKIDREGGNDQETR